MIKENWESVAPIDPERMLEQLHRAGEDAGSDFHDGENMQGWFGWEVYPVTGSASGTVLSHELKITYTPLTEAGDGADEERAVTRRWRLEPVDEP